MPKTMTKTKTAQRKTKVVRKQVRRGTTARRGKTAHQAAVAALVPAEHRADYQRRVKALLARQTLVSVIDATRESQRINKRELAERAGLEPSSVRRMLTSETANPTADNAFRLLGAMGVKVEAVLPSGKRVGII